MAEEEEAERLALEQEGVDDNEDEGGNNQDNIDIVRKKSNQKRDRRTQKV